jgi:hypothetical protein
MISIGLGAYRTWPEDEYGQSSSGWRPGLTDDEVYTAARGRWKLGVRADRARYVVFTAMGIVVLAIEIESISDADPEGRRTISGTILKPGQPVYGGPFDDRTKIVHLGPDGTPPIHLRA